jgi:hypothetical protein
MGEENFKPINSSLINAMEFREIGTKASVCEQIFRKKDYGSKGYNLI